MGSPWTSHKVIEFLQENKNLEVTTQDIQKATGLKHTQILSSINNLKMKPELKGKIHTIIRGRVWRYTDEPVAAAAAPNHDTEYFEKIYTTPSGVVIVRDEAGENLYSLKKLDLPKD